ncbi:MAG: ArnT family glycosyltransferase [Endomicrobiales bacterium]
MEETRTDRLFYLSLLFALLIKVMLALAIPMTSDEAYFTVWGRYLDFGYYDHPPVTGWILHALQYLGNAQLLMRLPAILSTLLVGAGIYLVLRGYDRAKACLVAAFFLVSPINILDVLITTDTPLIVFSFLSVAFLFAALKEQRYAFYLLSGAFLGLAFLSKYFSVLLGLSYAAWFLVSKKNGKKTAGMALLFASAVPFVLVNIYWNYTHCWVNILFNLYNRNQKEEFSLAKAGIFAVSQLYLITPPAAYYLWRSRKELARRSRELWAGLRDSPAAVFAFAFLIPLAVFALLSFKKVIGLHWVLGFYPFLYVVLFFLLKKEDIVKSIHFMAVFSAVHLFLIGAVLSLPLKYLQGNKNYEMIVLGTKPGTVLRELAKYGRAFHLATPSYADSSILTYHSGEYFSVFGGGSHHGRQDDLLTDFSKLDGRDILILRTSPPEPGAYAPFFERVELDSSAVSGATFFFVRGYGFNYGNYRERVLKDIKEKYYRLPSYLPYSRTSCYFYDKYFREELR